ncbi:hypothetical protein K503DRAFT_127015 [Rhizopogon vinicolor AM-OR11-026]|uniref:Uncharacterized protein n=1 Tax=Rhizopogon vinicolor AM-OR11-026 TaxID=1314800 RepID=A0A1B7N213_9AGAM|nr:hypothetical protein K503DRAFT_127015 [Rhizopogon vinicolor AM-OR11-026]
MSRSHVRDGQSKEREWHVKAIQRESVVREVPFLTIFTGMLSSPVVLSSLVSMNINWFSGCGFRLEQETLQLQRLSWTDQLPLDLPTYLSFIDHLHVPSLHPFPSCHSPRELIVTFTLHSFPNQQKFMFGCITIPPALLEPLADSFCLFFVFYLCTSISSLEFFF